MSQTPTFKDGDMKVQIFGQQLAFSRQLCLLAISLALVVGCSTGGQQGPATSHPEATTPEGATTISTSQFPISDADAKLLDDVSFAADQEVLAVSRDQALAYAAAEYDPDQLGAVVEGAFLEVATVKGTLPSENPIRELPVWIIKYSGMSNPHGPNEESTVELTTAYIFLNAASGEFLLTSWH